jgi:hypothetical protein
MPEGKLIYPLWMLPIFVNEEGEFVEPMNDTPRPLTRYDWY